ncbi:BQ2448_3360 [Microbotryum intermedium]|uniref:BQ2448_3360 protein n=1 Tax=Microbotryum intermedium TaxID=269621 RepID=A0A238FHG4_9BASI|nr:BQ2448_3360 [Microbotryum intermedium]
MTRICSPLSQLVTTTLVVLALSFGRTTSAAPIELAGESLTAETWKTVNNGTWLVEHYSPYCPHFVQLKRVPTASQNFYFAQVDCAANGDLCNLNNVKYYPSIFLYRRGVFVEEYSGKRAVFDLDQYIDKQMLKNRQAIQDKKAAEPKVEKGAQQAAQDVQEGGEEDDEEETQAEVLDKVPQDKVKTDKLAVIKQKSGEKEGTPRFKGPTQAKGVKSNVKPKGPTREAKLHLNDEDAKEEKASPSALEVILEGANKAAPVVGSPPLLKAGEKGKELLDAAVGSKSGKTDDSRESKDGVARLRKGSVDVDAPPSFVAQPHQQIDEKRNNHPLPDGQVHILEPTQIDAVKSDDAPPFFVKFYAPWCGHCKALKPRWVDVAEQLKGKVDVYEMDCDQKSTKKVCAAEKIQAYPTLMLYHQGQRVEYNGPRDVESMHRFVTRVVDSTKIKPLANEYELKRVVAVEPVVVLFLYSPSLSKDDLRIATTAARSLQGDPSFYTSTSPDLFSLFSVDQEAVFLVFKGQSLQPSSRHVFPSASTSALTTPEARIENISNWMRWAKLPSLVELNSATINDVLPATGDDVPLVVLGLFSKSQMKKDYEDQKIAFEGLANGWAERSRKGDKSAREVVWAWVDADRWMAWLKSMYSVNWGKRPGIVVSDPKELVYWNRDLSFEPITAESVYETVEQGILTNRLRPLSSRSFFDRLAHRFMLLTDSSFKSYFSSHPFALVFFVISSWMVGWWIVRQCLGRRRGVSMMGGGSGPSGASGKGGTAKYE